MADCSPQGLSTAVQCYLCAIPDGAHPAIQTMLLAQIRAALVPGSSIDPQTIAQQSVCFRCLDGNQAAPQTLLLCNIVTALGG